MLLNRTSLIPCLAAWLGSVLLLTSLPAAAQAPAPPATAAPGAPPRQPVPPVPAHDVDLIVGRPAATSVVLSLLSQADLAVVVAYGQMPGALLTRTAPQTVTAGQPATIRLADLQPDTHYDYRVLMAEDGKELLAGSFHTQRPPGSSFTFTVTADSHLDQNTDPALYLRTLANAVADQPDFHVDLGDTFMTEKHDTREHALQQYLAQRYYFGQLCARVPLLVVLGNHDGEEGRLLRGGADSLAVWANATRKRYFPNPVADGFYSGSAARDPWAGDLQDYYAWQWGDALFIALDPYWCEAARRGDERWGLSLGAEQYAWLARTLAASQARWKFVFIHQLVGGLDSQGRGGVEGVAYGEWGGQNADSSAGFSRHRPGWALPIHPLLVRHHVTMVLHGHDHFYARQELDGIVYQEVPQPGWPGLGEPRQAAEYGYRAGVILPSSGHLRVTVSPTQVTTAYVRAFLPRDETTTRPNRQVLDPATLTLPATPLAAVPPASVSAPAHR